MGFHSKLYHIYIYIYIYIYVCVCGGACGIMVIVVGSGHNDLSLNPRWGGISQNTNTLGKGMHPPILSLAIGK